MQGPKRGDRLSNRGTGEAQEGEIRKNTYNTRASDRRAPFHRKTRKAARPLSETTETGAKKGKYITCPHVLPKGFYYDKKNC